MYTTIDISRWKRRATFEFFRDFEDPFFNLTSMVDVSVLLQRCRETKSSFFLNSLHAATRAANETAAFRLRLKDGDVVEYATLDAGSTVLMSDHTFTFCYFNYVPDREKFVREGGDVLEKHLRNPAFDPRDEALGMLHFSVIPWVAFTGFKHARRFGREDSIPKIVFGKYTEQDKKLMMPVSVEVHHALADGYDVGLFFDRFQTVLDS